MSSYGATPIGAQIVITWGMTVVLGICLAMPNEADIFNKAYIAEISGPAFPGIVKVTSCIAINKKPNFWVREKKQSSSEVDLVITYRTKVIPVEIKSGSDRTLKSLHQFVEAADHPYAVRMYAGEFKVLITKTPGGKPYLLMNLPYYLATQLNGYLEYFLSNYKL